MMKKNWKIILAAVSAVVIAVVAFAVILLGRESYRSIQVHEVEGIADVDRIRVGVLDAYAGMMLQNEDAVSVESESYLYLKLDEDKLSPTVQSRLICTLRILPEQTSRWSLRLLTVPTTARHLRSASRSAAAISHSFAAIP